MPVKFVDEALAGFQAKLNLENAARVKEEAEYNAIDRLYETNPVAGIDRAKKSGFLPQNAELTYIDHEGTSIPAVNIPGLAKPIILPTSSRKEYYAAKRPLTGIGARTEGSLTVEEKKQGGRKELADINNEASLEQIAKKVEGEVKVEGVKQGGRKALQATAGDQALEQIEARGVETRKTAETTNEYTLGQIAARQEGDVNLERVRQANRVESQLAQERIDTRMMTRKSTVDEYHAVNKNIRDKEMVKVREDSQDRLMTRRLINSPSYNPLIGKKVDIPKLSPTAATETEVALTMGDLESTFDSAGLDDDSLTRIKASQTIVEAAHVLHAAHSAKKSNVTPSATREKVLNTIADKTSQFWRRDANGDAELDTERVQAWVNQEADAILWKDAVTEARGLYPQYKNLPDSFVIRDLKNRLSQPSEPVESREPNE